MKILDNMKGRSVIRCTADHFGESELQVRKDMQEALDAAWATDDPAAKKLQEDLFPDGKPTLEQFIVTLGRHIREQQER